VAEEYAAVFDSIGLRVFEWPWIRRLVKKFRPRSLLDLGCGNGYLSKALQGMAPELYALEPSSVMYSIAARALCGGVTLRQGAVEAMPFADGCFDMVVSLLSFRYMAWDRALDEIRRVLKEGGIFILVDLFDGSFNPRYFHRYLSTWTAVRLLYIRNRDYRKKLRRLTENSAWQRMIAEHPRRNIAEAKEAVAQKFHVEKFRLLSAGLRGVTAGFVCRKKTAAG
jgi:ubiquinone/menaquinone biosynthesis C-methylase UbiE